MQLCHDAMKQTVEVVTMSLVPEEVAVNSLMKVDAAEAEIHLSWVDVKLSW